MKSEEDIFVLDEELRNHDFDRYLLSFFAPREMRKALRTIDMLNIELSHIQQRVENPHLGLIRLHWWSDEIQKIYVSQDAADHPLLRSIAEAVVEYHFAFEDIDKVVMSRQSDFDALFFQSVEELAQYAARIHVPLMGFKLKLLNASEKYNHIAIYYTLVGLVRSIVYYANRGKYLVPGVHEMNLHPHDPNLKAAVRAVIMYIESDASFLKKPKNRYLKATRCLTRLYITQIKKADYDPFFIKPIPFKELQVWLGSLL